MKMKFFGSPITTRGIKIWLELQVHVCRYFKYFMHYKFYFQYKNAAAPIYQSFML